MNFNSGQYNISSSNVINILKQYNYEVKENGNYIVFPAKWRNGLNDSVTCYPAENHCIDWVIGEHFDIKELLNRVTSSKSKEEMEKLLLDNNINLEEKKPILIKQKKVFDESLLLYIQPDYSYPISRGISEETVKLFESGRVGIVKGKLRNSYTFIIRNSKNEIIGFSGRNLNPKSDRKYIHIGEKSTWVYSAAICDKFIASSKCAVLVESVFDTLTLFDNGIKNNICCFGTEVSYSIINYLLRRGVEKIVFAFNNEPDNNNIGATACQKAKKRMSRFWDMKNLIIKMPQGVTDLDKNSKDFNELKKESLDRYINELRLQIGEKYFIYE